MIQRRGYRVPATQVTNYDEPSPTACVPLDRYCIAELGLRDEKALPDDLVARIAACLPEAWKVGIVSHGNLAAIRVETEPMDTVSSVTRADHRKEKRTVVIEFDLLPKYSPGMLKQIQEFNEPISHRLANVRDGRLPEGQRLRATLIPYPMFEDAHYSYRIVPPDRVASRGEDIALIERVLVKVCAGWKPIRKGNRVVGEIMEYFSPG